MAEAKVLLNTGTLHPWEEHYVYKPPLENKHKTVYSNNNMIPPTKTVCHIVYALSQLLLPHILSCPQGCMGWIAVYEQ